MAQDSLNSSRRASLFYLGWLAAVAIVLGTLASLVLAREVWIRRQSGALEAESRRGRPVLVEPVSFAPKARTVVFPGDVHGFYETELFAKVPGYIRSIKVDKGTRVRKGQPLAEIESPELDHQVQDARADYNLRIVTDRRFQEMVRHGAASQQQADQTHADMLQARAHWLSLEAQQAYERVEAPFDGVITARNVDPGALVTLNTASTGAVPLLAIATLKPLRVYVRMPQEQAVYVKDGDPAVVAVRSSRPASSRDRSPASRKRWRPPPAPCWSRLTCPMTTWRCARACTRGSESPSAAAAARRWFPTTR